jgi:type IV pilus assembly protein PilM
MAAVGTGVTIGSRSVRVLQVRRQKSGNWEVTRALISHLSEQDPPDARRVAEARSVARSAEVKGPALVGLTGRDLIVRYTQVPPVPDWRLEMLMNFEVQEVAEQSGGDVSAAYRKLEVDDTTSGDEVVMVALAKNGYLRPRLDALAAAGLDVRGGCPRAVAAWWSYKENGRLRADETVVVMHVGHENTDVAISRGGVLVFARNVSGGGKLFTEAVAQNMRVDFATAEKLKVQRGNLTPKGKVRYRDSMEEKVANAMGGAGGHLVSAFNSSVMFAKAQTKVPDCKPDRLVVMGSAALLRGLPEYLESALGVPVELFDPLAAVDLSALGEETRSALLQDQGGMAVTLGLAQMAADPAAFRVEVLPEADRRKRRFKEQTVFSIAAAAVLVVALVVSAVSLGSAHDAATAEARVLDERAKLYQNNKADFERARSEVEEHNRRLLHLRRTVSMGPALQRVTDLVHETLAADPGYPEVYFTKVWSRWIPLQVSPPGDAVQVEHFPAVEFEGKVQPVGARDVPSAFSELMAEVKGRVDRAGGLELQEIGGLAPDGTFKFRVLEREFPERLRAAPAEGR